MVSLPFTPHALGVACLVFATGALAQTRTARPAAAAPSAPVAAVAGAASAAEPASPDRAELERTQITGSRELPKVLYIVPWKKPPPGQPIARPERSVIDDALLPIERAVLQRQIGYHRQLATPAAGGTAALRP
ncbi:MAG: hypothetical protein ACOVOT_16410 [Rubrivivax sp.]|nr:hypothetical protein [Rubrivivax sp.]